jgi:tRNA-modifying protein YgfZ
MSRSKTSPSRWPAVAVEGPHAAAVLAAIGAPVPDAELRACAWNGAIVERVSETGAPGFRIFMPVEAKADWIARLESAGAVHATPDEARTVRLEHGKPRYGEDIFDTTLPQETRQMHAVHFTKGCYLGQEIVERIRSRGHVNRLLVKLEVEGESPLARGTKVTAGAAEAGEITSSAFSPALGESGRAGLRARAVCERSHGARRGWPAGYCRDARELVYRFIKTWPHHPEVSASNSFHR